MPPVVLVDKMVKLLTKIKSTYLVIIPHPKQPFLFHTKLKISCKINYYNSFDTVDIAHLSDQGSVTNKT